MASNDIKVKVSVEASIHKAMVDFAQLVFAEHGVQVRRIDIDWWDMKTPTDDKSFVAAVQIESKTTAGSLHNRSD